MTALAAAPQAWQMWSWLYQGLLVLAWPWVHVRLRWRARREPAYGDRIGERFGRVPTGLGTGPVWFHTVSAGETIAAAPVIAALLEAFPGQRFLVTTMTPTGSAQVRARLGDRVDHCYAPYDFPWAVRRFYDRIRPRLLVLMETELWPNLIAEAGRRGIPALLVNARLSEPSARGYARLGRLTRDMLTRLRWLACQYPDHARRFIDLGAPRDRVVVHGNVKFDVTLPDDFPARVSALRGRFRLDRETVWIAASTHPGEEALVLAAHEGFRARRGDVRLILVPRHPARADEVAALCRARNLTCARLSTPGVDDARADVVLGDTMGELLYLYGLAAVAFVGGSLNGGGGHNPIEPALCGLPVVMGPDLFNFADVTDVFQASGCLRVAGDADDLAERVGEWLSAPAVAREVGERARAVVADNRGAKARLESLLLQEVRAVSARGRTAGGKTAGGESAGAES